MFVVSARFLDDKPIDIQHIKVASMVNLKLVFTD